MAKYSQGTNENVYFGLFFPEGLQSREFYQNTKYFIIFLAQVIINWFSVISTRFKCVCFSISRK